MSTIDLYLRVALRNTAAPGTWLVSVRSHRRALLYYTHNSEAVDRIRMARNGVPNRARVCSYTYRQALQALYDECLSYHGIRV